VSATNVDEVSRLQTQSPHSARPPSQESTKRNIPGSVLSNFCRRNLVIDSDNKNSTKYIQCVSHISILILKRGTIFDEVLDVVGCEILTCS
jgi:hypothetical protein